MPLRGCGGGLLNLFNGGRVELEDGLEELDEGNLLGTDIALDLLANRALHVVDLSAWVAVGAASLRR